jgi:hypothetical protein
MKINIKYIWYTNGVWTLQEIPKRVIFDLIKSLHKQEWNIAYQKSDARKLYNISKFSNVSGCFKQTAWNARQVAVSRVNGA